MQNLDARRRIDGSFWLGECLIEPASARVTRGETCTTLEARQLRLLLLLAAHSGELLSYEAIERHVWPESQPDRETLFHCVSQLRRVLGDAPRAPRHIKTVPGQGYLLISQPRLTAPAVGTARRPVEPSPGKGHSWLGVGTLLLLACTLIVLHLLQREQRRDTARERDNAEQVSRLMVGSFALHEPRPDAGYQPVTATDLLMQSEQRLTVDLAEQPQLQAQMLQAIGTAYLRQSRYEHAFSALARSRSLYTGSGQGSPLQFAKVNSELSEAARGLGRINESLGYLRESAEDLRAADRTRSREYAWVLADRGMLSNRLGQPEEGLRDFNDALRLMNEVEGDSSSSSAAILGNMSHLYLWIDAPATAERFARKSVIYRSTLPPLHPDRITAEAQLGGILPHRGQLREAEELLRSALDSRRQLFGTRGLLVASTLFDLGELQMSQQHWAEAEDLIRQAIIAYDAVNQRPMQELIHMETALGRTILSQDRAHEAATLLSDAIATCQQITLCNLHYQASAEHVLGEAQLAAGDFKAAEQTLNVAVKHLDEARAMPWRMARSRNTLGEVLLRTGRRAQGIKLLRESHRQLLLDRAADRLAQEQATERVKRLLSACGGKSSC